jgi:hypothetical protein
LLWLFVIVAAGLLLARGDPGPRNDAVPALRFGGADLVYVLRRLAAEAGLLLALDEIRPLAVSEDLAAIFVDADLPSGTIERALRLLQRDVGGFDYEFYPGVLYVRSRLELEADTGIDRKELPGGTFEGDLMGLGEWIQRTRPGTYFSVHLERGHPAGPRVRMQVPPQSSVLDVLLLYARESGVGWRMRRAGQVVERTPERTVIVASEVQPWKPLPIPRNTAPIRQEESLLQAIARVSLRSEIPYCVLDAAPLFVPRGTLDLTSGIDSGARPREALEQLSHSHTPGDAPPYRWEALDGVVKIRVEGLDRLPALAEMLHVPLPGGTFEGSLAELARWLSAQLRERTDYRVVGGEIALSAPRGRITVAPNTTVEEVLVAFTRASGGSSYAVVYDRQRPDAPVPEPWHGAFLSQLSEWAETARPY